MSTQETKTFFEINQITQHGLENALKADVYVVPQDLKPGQWVAQGDLNFIIVKSIPSNAKLVKNPSLQLAPGNSKGSRHCLNSLQNVDVYSIENGNALLGYWLKIKGETIVTHPEHKHQVWRTNSDGSAVNMIVTYQRQHAEELRRIED